MRFASYQEAVARKADSRGLLRYVVDTMAAFNDGKDVVLDFLGRDDVGGFCSALGFASDRNWAALALDSISPRDETGTPICPEAESAAVLAGLQMIIARGYLTPHDGVTPAPNILNDFLPTPGRFKGRRTLGHLREFRYALAVELEHGRYRGMNVTNNHPVLTGMIVMSHLTEDPLYYARLWVMETEGELLDAELTRKPFQEIHDTLARLAAARRHLADRVAERIKNEA